MMFPKVVGAAGVAGLVFAAGAVVAGGGVTIEGSGRGDSAELDCPGGMSHLGHVFTEDANTFPGDPATDFEIVTTVEVDGFQVEQVTFGTHTSTHLDAPLHFLGEPARSVDDLAADEFVWPAYVIDVRDRIAVPGPDDFQLSVADVRAYERRNGRIPRGALVIIRTGWDAKFGTPAYDDPVAGFAGATVQWMVDNRDIDAIGSDTYGPDATSDELFDATFTILANDRVAVPGLDNLGAMNTTGDIVIATPIRLEDGSGFQVSPIACHGDD